MASREDDILVSIVTKVEGNGEKELKNLGTAGEKSLNKITTAADRANAALARLNAQQERAGRTVGDRGDRGAATTAARIAAEGKQQADNRRKQAEADKKAETATAAAVTAAAARTEARERAAAVRQEARDRAAAARQEAKDKAKQERAEEKERIAVDRRLEKQKAAAAKEAAVAKAAEIKEAAREKTAADRKAAKEKVEATRAAARKPAVDTKAEAEKKAEIAAYEKGLEEKRKLQAADQAKMDAEEKRQDAIRARRATERAEEAKLAAVAAAVAPPPVKQPPPLPPLTDAEERKLALQNAIARNTGQTLRQVQDPAEIARKNENRRKADAEAQEKLAAAKKVEEDKAEAARVKALAVQARAARLAGGGGAGGGGGGGREGFGDELRIGLRALMPALNMAGASLGALGPALALASAGVLALSAALTAGLVVALEKTNDASKNAASRLGSFSGGAAKGAETFKELRELSKTLGTSATGLAKPFEQIMRAAQGGMPQTDMLKILGNLVKSADAERIDPDQRNAAISELMKSIREKEGLDTEAIKQFEEAIPQTGRAFREEIERIAPGQLAAGFVPKDVALQAAKTPEFKAGVDARAAESAAQFGQSFAKAFDNLKGAAERLASALDGSTVVVTVINALATLLDKIAAALENLPIATVLATIQKYGTKGAELGAKSPLPGGAAVGAAVGAGVGAFTGVGTAIADKVSPSGTGPGTELQQSNLVAAFRDVATESKKTAESVKGLGTSATEAGKLQKDINKNSAVINREKAKIDFDFIDREQESNRQHNKINVERAEQSIRAAQIGKKEAEKQLALASITEADQRANVRTSKLSLERARMEEDKAGRDPEKSVQENLLEQEEARERTLAAERALKRAKIERDLGPSEEEKARLAVDQANTALRSAQIEKDDADLKLAKDEAGQPLDRDLSALRYAQAQLDAITALGKTEESQLQTLNQILEAISKLGGGSGTTGTSGGGTTSISGGGGGARTPDEGIHPRKMTDPKEIARQQRIEDERAYDQQQRERQQRLDKGLPAKQSAQEILDEEKANQQRFNQGVREQFPDSKPSPPQAPGIGERSDLGPAIEGLKTAIETNTQATQQETQTAEQQPQQVDQPQESIAENLKGQLDQAATAVNGVTTAMAELSPALQGGASAAGDFKTATEGAGPAADKAEDGLEGVNPAAKEASSGLRELASTLQQTSASGGEGGAVEAATGGFVSGPGTATSDSIPARLSRGEFVQSAKATQFWGVDFMRAINNLKAPRFAAGGLVGVPRFAEGGLVDAPVAKAQTPQHLGTIDLRTDHGMLKNLGAPPDAATQLQRLAVTQRMTTTGKPGFVS